jgi:hypothetical protein
MIALALLWVLAAGRATPDPLVQLREDYTAAVSDPAAIERGLAGVAALRRSHPAGSATPLAVTVTAYQGALITLRAKHATWPPTKLRHLRSGLAILDSVVVHHPEHVEARWLRLMSCYSLPGVLGRKRSVSEDFSALAALLPGARAELPPEKYLPIVSFVLENASLSRGERARLEVLLAPSDG